MKKPEFKTTWIVEKNIKNIYIIIEEYRKDPKYKHLRFNIKKPKNSNSVYITVTTKVSNTIFRAKKRLSDHTKKGEKYGTEWLSSKRSLQEIKKVINSLIRQVESKRLKFLMNRI